MTKGSNSLPDFSPARRLRGAENVTFFPTPRRPGFGGKICICKTPKQHWNGTTWRCDGGACRWRRTWIASSACPAAPSSWSPTPGFRNSGTPWPRWDGPAPTAPSKFREDPVGGLPLPSRQFLSGLQNIIIDVKRGSHASDDRESKFAINNKACIAHKSLEIFERCRLWQQNSPAMPDNSAAFSERTVCFNSFILKQALKWARQFSWRV